MIEDQKSTELPGDHREEESDELLGEAVEFARHREVPTISLKAVQTRFRVGAERGFRLLEGLERAKVIGPPLGSGEREILVDRVGMDIGTSSGSREMGDDPRADLFSRAEAYVRERGSPTVSLLQRRFRLGYEETAELLEELERRG